MSEANAPIEEEVDFDSAFDEFSETPDGDDGEDDDDLRIVNEEDDEPEEEDPLAGLSESQRKLFEEMERRKNDLEHRLQSDQGRVSALQRHINDLQNQIQANQEAKAPVVGEATDDMWNEFAKEYPELSKAIEQRVAAREKELEAKLANSFQPVTSKLNSLERQEQQRYLRSQLDLLTERHPDWREVRDTKEFTDFLNTAPRQIKEMANSQDAGEVSYLLTVFKERHGKGTSTDDAAVQALKEKRQRQLSEGAALHSAPSKAGTRSIAKDDFDGAFDAYAAQAERRMRK